MTTPQRCDDSPAVKYFDNFGPGTFRAELTDHSISSYREFLLDPFDAYPEVCDYILGRPGAVVGQNAAIQPPLTHPYHQNIRALSCTVRPLQEDVSYNNLKGDGEHWGVYDGEGNLALEALDNPEGYLKAVIGVSYGERPDWLVSFQTTPKNFSLPGQYLVWENILEKDGVTPARLGLVGAGDNATDAVLNEVYRDIVLTPYRHPAGGDIIPRMLTWEQLAGRINRSAWEISLRSAVDGQIVVRMAFPPETLLFMGPEERVETSTLTRDSGVYSTGTSDCPKYLIAHDYWNHSFRFSFRGTVATNFAAQSAPSAYNPGTDGNHPQVPAGSGFLPYSELPGQYVGWNRFLFPGGNNTDTAATVWDYAKNKVTGRRVYQYAEDLVHPTYGAGFNMLFNW